MIQVDGRVRRTPRVTTPGARGGSGSVARRAAIDRASDCALALADGVDEVRLHHYYSDAIGALQAHLERDGHDLRAMEGHTGAWFRKVRAIAPRGVAARGAHGAWSARNAGALGAELPHLAGPRSASSRPTSRPRRARSDGGAFLYDAFPGRFTLIVGPSNASRRRAASPSLGRDVRADARG